MKVWITKYALTQGIFEREAEESQEFKGMIETIEEESTCFHGEGRDWHRTRVAAVKHAEEMRQKKIESLKKQINKLEVMKFE